MTSLSVVQQKARRNGFSLSVVGGNLILQCDEGILHDHWPADDSCIDWTEIHLDAMYHHGDPEAWAKERLRGRCMLDEVPREMNMLDEMPEHRG